MKNNGWTYFLIVALVLSGIAVAGSRLANPDMRHLQTELIKAGAARALSVPPGAAGDPEPGPNLDAHLIGIFCGALAIGCLAGFFFRRRPQGGKPHQLQPADTLSSVSSDTGINEYELFSRAAENWAVSKKRMAHDFKIYMATQRLPFYVTDFVRKNRSPEEQLPTAEKPGPSSWSDWIKALLVFPGSFVFLFAVLVLLP